MFEFLKKTVQNAPSPSFDTIGGFLGAVVNIVLGIGISLSTIAIILSGIRFITSRGDFKAVAQAKSALTYSVVALILTLGALSIKLIITNLLGVTSQELIDAVPNI